MADDLIASVIRYRRKRSRDQARATLLWTAIFMLTIIFSGWILNEFDVWWSPFAVVLLLTAEACIFIRGEVDG